MIIYQDRRYLDVNCSKGACELFALAPGTSVSIALVRWLARAMGYLRDAGEGRWRSSLLPIDLTLTNLGVLNVNTKNT